MPLPKEGKQAMEQVASVIRPVSITMLLVVYCVVELCNPYSFGNPAACHAANNNRLIPLAYQENDQDSTIERAGGAALNALIVVAGIVGVTFVMVILYKYRCMKCLMGYMYFSVAVLLGVFGGQFVTQVIHRYGIIVDQITLYILLFNWTVVGVCSGFWEACRPPQLWQFFLVFISAMMAWVLSYLPSWTGWAILVGLAIYDIFAVLCPGGPLRMLVEEAQRRDDAIPALVYDTDAAPRTDWRRQPRLGEGVSAPSPADADVTSVSFEPEPQGGYADDAEAGADTDGSLGEADSQSESSHDNQSESSAATSTDMSESSGRSTGVGDPRGDAQGGNEGGGGGRERAGSTLYENDAEGSLKLGLGDFIFYSVLVGKSATFGVATITASFVAILMGLCLTLLVLWSFEKALPALPISIFLGLLFTSSTQGLLMPLVVSLGDQPVFI